MQTLWRTLAAVSEMIRGFRPRQRFMSVGSAAFVVVLILGLVWHFTTTSTDHGDVGCGRAGDLTSKSVPTLDPTWVSTFQNPCTNIADVVQQVTDLMPETQYPHVESFIKRVDG